VGFLSGKKILLTGMISHRSIAYGIATAMKREGAELAFAYAGDAVRERTEKYAPEFDSDIIIPCDVSKDEDITNLFVELGKRWDHLDGFVHAIAFAPREAIAGDFLDGMSRESFRIAHDISSYSFAAMAKAALPMMTGRNAAILTLSYLGAERVVPTTTPWARPKRAWKRSPDIWPRAWGRKGYVRMRFLPGRLKHWRRRALVALEKCCRFLKSRHRYAVTSRRKRWAMWRHF
jgi:enoyl-[acyl-carrier protein] reductase I